MRLAPHGNQPVAALMGPHFAMGKIEQQACQHLCSVAAQVLRQREATEEGKGNGLLSLPKYAS